MQTSSLVTAHFLLCSPPGPAERFAGEGGMGSLRWRSNREELGGGGDRVRVGEGMGWLQWVGGGMIG